ncbi:uncharacterized protein LOC117107652 [Anneissia japonica]|uniref:uncharacterized protein LOC117107652 n=1 Tax=Anneissia japonica TaxID=1529436 RepID=UPI0014257A0C|nr:uncharacterized protein LOC117107652 [Anneissia japonica]
MTSVHLPFCAENCNIEHCPLLISVLNTHRQNMTELSLCIQSYKTSGWKMSDNVPDPCKDFQYPLLHWACALGKFSMVKWLVREGFDPNLQTEAGDTAIHRAIISLRTRVTKLTVRGLDSVVDLLSDNLSLRNVKRETPMLQLAHMLIKKEISVDYFSLWMICCTDAIVNLPPEKRAAVTDAQDHDGNTVVHLMVKQLGILPSIRRMVNAKANLQIRNKWGQTAMDIARNNKSEDYVQHLTLVSGLRWPGLASKGDTSLVRSSPRLQLTAPTCQSSETIKSKSMAVAVSSPRKRLNSTEDVASPSTVHPAATKRGRKSSPHRRVTFDVLQAHITGPTPLEEARSSFPEGPSVNDVEPCIKCEFEEEEKQEEDATSGTESSSYTNDAMYSPDVSTSESSGFFEYLKISPGFKKEIIDKLEHDKQQFQAIINQEETIRLVEQTELKQLLAETKSSDEKIVALLSQVEKLQSRNTEVQKKINKLNQNASERLERVNKIKNKLLVCMKTVKELEQDNGKS